MAKQRPEKTDNPAASQKRATTPATSSRWSLWVRLAASAWVVWHLFAVFISPFNAFSAPRASLLVERLATSPYVRWYSDPIYINGGYQFFSPDPPEAGTLVRYRVRDDRGDVVVQGEFPNRANESYARQWPRLWYHRHMMLADQSSEALVYWNDDGTPNRLENTRLTMRAYARHLLRKHGGALVELDYLEHRALFPSQAVPWRIDPQNETPRPDAQPIDPTDPSLYSTILSVRETATQLTTPLVPPRDGFRSSFDAEAISR